MRRRRLVLCDGVDVGHLGAQAGVLHGRHADPDHGRAPALGDLHELRDPLGVERVPLRRGVRDVGRPEEVLGVVGPDHDHDHLGLHRLEVRRQLRRPVEVVGPGQPRALPGVERRVDDPGAGEVDCSGPPMSRPMESPTIRTRSGLAAVGSLGLARHRRRGRGGRPPVCGPAPCPGRDPPAGRFGPRSRRREARPSRPGRRFATPGHRDDVGELQCPAQRRDRAHEVEAHGPARADRGHLRVVLQGRREEQQPDGEGARAETQDAHPTGPHPAVGRRRQLAVRVRRPPWGDSQCTGWGGVRASVIRTGSR